jgi:hypothetical protein
MLARFLLILLTTTFFSPVAAPAQMFKPTLWPQWQLPSWGGMVTFSIDDANKNVHENGLPVFRKYRVAGTLAPIVGAVENQEYWIMTWPQIKDFHRAGWEIASHTMWHPRLTSLSDAELEYELGQSKKLLGKNGIDAKTLVFPYAQYDARVLDYTTRYYENSRIGGDAVNGIDLNRYTILCKELTSTTTPEEAIAWIEEAVQKKMWLVLMIHEIVAGTPGDYQYNAGDLEKIVAYVSANRIPAPTINQALAGRQAVLGPNLIKNSKLEIGAGGWAQNWSRNNETQVTLEPVAVKRAFSDGKLLKITGSSEKNMANPDLINLPDKDSDYLLSFFAQVATEGANGGVEICIDEFDASGNWIGWQWIGGFWWYTCGMPAFLYHPSSGQVDQVVIYIFTDEGADVTLLADNFYFGAITDGMELQARFFRPKANLRFGAVTGGRDWRHGWDWKHRCIHWQ